MTENPGATVQIDSQPQIATIPTPEQNSKPALPCSLGPVIAGSLAFILTLACIGAAMYLSREEDSVVRIYHFVVAQKAIPIGDRTFIVNTINGDIKGPAIHVRRGETLSVKVTNKLSDSGLTLHWHGFHMRTMQVYDGVAGVTQCPIAPGETLLYEFVVDEAPGTYWYHTQNGVNPSGQDFVRGPLIVHDVNDTIASLDDPYLDPSNRDVVLFYRDLYPNFLGLDLPLWLGGKTAIGDDSVEGDGISSRTFVWTNGVLNGEEQAEIKVRNGEYRFRIINGGDNFAYFFSIDSYKLTVVAVDGNPVEPYETDIILVHVGERFDILITFEIETPTQDVWIRAMTTSEKQDKGIFGVLRVRQNTSVPFSDVTPAEKERPVNMEDSHVLNCKFFDTPQINCHPVTDLVPFVEQTSLNSSSTDTDEAAANDNELVEEIHTIDFDFIERVAGWFVSIDQGTFTQNLMSKLPLIMSLAENETSPHTLALPIHTNKVVAIVLRNKSRKNIPIHLHGHTLEILEVATRKTSTCDKNVCPLLDLTTAFSVPIEELVKRQEGGVLKSTVPVPPGGAVVVRLHTDNPGVWLLHSSVPVHSVGGLALVINVGDFMFSQTDTPADYPSCDFSGRLQTEQVATCTCSGEELGREGLVAKCSRPWTCGE
ncbi:hypothetical protein ACHWQZ_G012504 [Mnemiopsis leidyi]